jgi:integrase
VHTDQVPLIRTLAEIDKATGEHAWEPLFSPYALRHWYASYLIKVRGKNPKQIQRLMGHERIELTFQIYGHLWSDPKDDAAVAEGLDALLKAANDGGT